MSKIVLGMSGGVDSSVCAYLLKQQGHEVIGLFMRNWDAFLNNDVLGNKTKDEMCPQELDFLDAKKVADQLNIKLYRVNFINEYWDFVFKKFLSDYTNGHTPNPDILCNKYIKFDAFIKYAEKEFAPDKIAMGHYAKTDGEGRLFKPKDLNKDQTYFLSQLNDKQLKKTLFPLENLTKSEVREIAKNLNLATANKKDSTGICFIGERKFQDFLSNYIPAQEGDVINIQTNEIVGKHKGIMYYTIGQRKGLHLSGMDEPFYVAGHNLKEKILYVAPSSDRTSLLSNKCTLIDLNIIQGSPEKLLTKGLKAKFRYRQNEVPVHVDLKNNLISVIFESLVEAVTPGQQCVFYLDNECIGGGIIHEVFYNNEKRVFL